MSLLRRLDPAVYDLVQPYRVTDDALMPWAYQRANPQGRPLHNDWGIMSASPILKALQPWQSIRRMDTAYRVPLPFRGRAACGTFEQRWMLWDPAYPAAPGLQVEDKTIYDGKKNQVLPHALVDCAVEGSGRAEFEAYLNGQWVHVFTSYRKIVGGRLLAWYSGGLKQDLTISFDDQCRPKSDVMGWWDPPSLSWNKIATGGST